MYLDPIFWESATLMNKQNTEFMNKCKHHMSQINLVLQFLSLNNRYWFVKHSSFVTCGSWQTKSYTPLETIVSDQGFFESR